MREDEVNKPLKKDRQFRFRERPPEVERFGTMRSTDVDVSCAEMLNEAGGKSIPGFIWEGHSFVGASSMFDSVAG